MLDQSTDYEHLLGMRYLLAQLFHQYELHQNMFSWRWWLVVLMTLLPWGIWWLLRNKQRAQETLLYGCLIGLAAAVLDSYGTSFVWWSYPVKILQGIPTFLTADLAIVPVSMMLAYQHSRNFKTFFLLNAIVAFFIAFVGEPIGIWLGYYHLYTWRLAYSFVFYVCVGVIAWGIVRVHSPSSTFPKKSN